MNNRIGKSPVIDVKKNEEKIRNNNGQFDMSTKKCKVMQLADDEMLDQALFLWFVIMSLRISSHFTYLNLGRSC